MKSLHTEMILTKGYHYLFAYHNNNVMPQLRYQLWKEECETAKFSYIPVMCRVRTGQFLASTMVPLIQALDYSLK